MNNDQPIMWKLEEMISFCQKFSKIYIYGHEHDQIMLCKYLEMIDIRVEGYIVSENQKNQYYGVVSCKELKDTQLDIENIGIIVGTRDLYFNEIVNEILNAGFDMRQVHLVCGYNKRTISHKMTPRTKERMWIEVNLADHCNLNCQMCDHFAQLAKPTFLELDVFRKDMERLAELTNNHIDTIKLQGGEPLLNNQLIEFIKISRELFPKANLVLFTDGLLLKKWQDHPNGNLWQACHDYYVRIQLTVYPIGINIEEIEELSKKYDVVMDMFTEVAHRQLLGEKKSVKHPFDLDGNVDKWQFISCYQFNECITLRNGKLYTCPIIPYISHFNDYFGENLKVSENDYIDIYEVDSYEELAEFVTHRTDFCRYCNVKKRRAYDWKQSEYTIEEYI